MAYAIFIFKSTPFVKTFKNLKSYPLLNMHDCDLDCRSLVLTISPEIFGSKTMGWQREIDQYAERVVA